MKNIKFRIIACILCALICASALVSCSSDQPNVFDKIFGGETTTEEATTAGEEEVPRFDFFAADMNEYVNIPDDFYKSITVQLQNNYTATDEDVNESIDKQLFSAKKPLNDGERTTNVAMKRGDTAYIFYKGMMDGKEFEGGSNMSDETPYGLSLGSGSFIPGFEEGLIGVVPKDTSMEELHEINLKFPEDYGNSEYAGKEATFYVYVLYSVQYEVPELTKELITDTFKFKTEEEDVIAAYKKYVKDSLQAELDEARLNETRSLTWNQLLEKCEIKKYPTEEVDFYYNDNLDTFEYYYQQYQYMGYSFKDLDDFACQYMGLESGTDWKKLLREDCERQVGMYLICHAIAQREGIEVTDADYRNQLAYYVEYYASQGFTAEYIEENMGAAAIREGALNELVIEQLVLGNVTVKEFESEN